MNMTGEKIATRSSYGQALRELGTADPRVVVLDADLSGATMTKFFRDAHPDRFIDCGIAEANMMTAAAGLSTTGLIPFASTFAIFAAGRGYEQIRNSIAYPKLNVKICATHAGVSVGEDGGSHQAIEDLSLMRSIPGMTVLVPSDDTQARACLQAAYELNGPVYIRFGRLPVSQIYTPETCTFEIGKGQIVRDGRDAAILACGLEVQEALEAALLLAAEGLDIRVVDMASIKPLDEELVLECARTCGKLITVEEHNIIGGLGSAVAETVTAHDPVPVLRIGVQDVFGQSGNGRQLIHEYGLDAASIADTVRAFLSRQA